MKCKARWIKSMRTWQIYCPTHECYIVMVAPVGEPDPLPHDVTLAHIEREH